MPGSRSRRKHSWTVKPKGNHHGITKALVLIHFYNQTNSELRQAVTKRAGRKKDPSNAQAASSGAGKPQVRKAAFESTKKKEVGVSDLTLISKISNEAINDNLKKRFENAEIYVRWAGTQLEMEIGRQC